MLEVHKDDDGLWVTNGDYRVFVSEDNLYNNTRLQVVSDCSDDNRAVYTFVKPMKVGKTYHGPEIIPQTNMVVIGVGSGCAYQYRDRVVLADGGGLLNVWVTTRSVGETMASLPIGEFTILHLGGR